MKRFSIRPQDEPGALIDSIFEIACNAAALGGIYAFAWVLWVVL